MYYLLCNFMEFAAYNRQKKVYISMQNMVQIYLSFTVELHV
jgi:hypothetical protein